MKKQSLGRQQSFVELEFLFQALIQRCAYANGLKPSGLKFLSSFQSLVSSKVGESLVGLTLLELFLHDVSNQENVVLIVLEVAVASKRFSICANEDTTVTIFPLAWTSGFDDAHFLLFVLGD